MHELDSEDILMNKHLCLNCGVRLNKDKSDSYFCDQECILEYLEVYQGEK